MDFLMRSFRLLVVALLVLPMLCGSAHAANITITFSNGQNTYTQTTLIPQANTDKCKEFGLGPSCTSANLVTAGCVAAPFSAVTKKNLVYRDCTIYTQDAAGEAAYDADRLYRTLLDHVSRDLQADVDASCAAFKALSQGTQDSVCSTLGRPAGCNICR